MNLLDVLYPEAAELLEIEKGELATSVYGLPVYFRVGGADDADAFHDGAAHAIQISIRYLDVGTDAITLAYTTDASTETTQTIVTKGDTGKWKWKHKTITSNARFDHSVYENFEYADFNIQCDSELILTNVTLRETALNTEVVWKATEERVTATDGEAAIDTTLFSGWTVSETYLARDTGTNNTSAGLAPDDYPFYAGATYANRATAPFRVTPAGALVATSATITGAITATSGAIGGFSIGADYVRDAANSFGLASTVTGSDDVRFWAGAAFASRASAPFRLTEAGVLVATSATITGSVTATSGAVGGWSIAATTLSSGSISLNSSTPKITLGSVTDYLNNTGIFMGLSGGAYKFSVGTTTKYFAFDGTNPIATGQWITGAGLNPSLQDWKTNIVFSSASATQVNWTSGTIRLNDGTTYSISSGNTGAMAALMYIYLDTAVSTTVLQTTTTYSTATGSGKLLIASAQNDTVAASVIPWGGQQPLLSGGQINALSILAGNIAAGAITSTKISVSQLSAIAADMGTITAGTVTGATIRTAASGARTEMSGTKIFGYDGTNNIWECDSGGMRILVDATIGTAKSYSLKGASAVMGGLYGRDQGATHRVQLSTDLVASSNAYLDIFSDAPAASVSNVSIESRTAGGVNSSLVVSAAGIQIASASSQKVGFFGVTAVTQRSAYTQTYSTANKTQGNLTSATLTDNTGGTASTTLAAITAGTTYAQLDMQRVKNALASLADQVNKLRNDLVDVKQFSNAIVDDLQALGLAA